jgi:N-acetylmuramoyl-L-alanine amidase
VNIRQIFLVILTFIPLFLVAGIPQNGKNIHCVVIDAGHGGHDPGAVGYHKAKEKDIALSIALHLGKLIEKNHPEIKVVYTRKTDVFVELHRRAAIANNNKADLFISIHCNSTKKSDPFGVETWVMGLHKSAANLEVAKKENASILMEKNHVAKYDGFNPNSAEAYIIFSLFQNMYINQSLSLANAIQLNFRNKLKFFDRGVKQAGFLVLYKTSMPSVLVETGFVSNPKDEKYLNQVKGQESIAYSLYESFLNYKSAIEGVKTVAPANPSLLTYDQIIVEKDTTNTKNSKSTQRVEIDSLTEKYVDKSIPRHKKNSRIVDSTMIYKQETTAQNNDSSDIVFRVQFLTSQKHKSLDSKEFASIDDVFEYHHGETYKYTAGKFTSIKEAVVYKSKLESMGYPDCFVVAFNKEARISPSEATRLLNLQNQKTH